jgi:hypothetical protein
LPSDPIKESNPLCRGTRADSDEIDPPSVVIAGLDPAIHLLARLLAKKMDPRVKPGGDECGLAMVESK